MTGLLLTVFCAYLIGSIPTAYIYCRLRGQDIRKHGSGNVGATNAARLFGKSAFFTVLLIDGLKGFVPVYLAKNLLVFDAPFITWVPLAVFLATVAGHVWTVFLKGKGGKGVATSTGGLLAIMPMASLFTVASFLIVFWRTRIVSLGSLCAALFFTIAVWVLGYPLKLQVLGTLLAVFIIWNHRSNIRRLLAGEESAVPSTRNKHLKPSGNPS